MINLNIFRAKLSHLWTLRLLRTIALFLTLSCPFAYAQNDEEFFDFDEGAEASPQIADPLESLNRMSFALNDKLYRGVLKPVARGLRVIPEPARVSADNFFDNLGTPLSAINALLQGDLPNTGTELGRFAINTSIGILGLFDPATDLGLAQDNEDLGQTLGHWGVGHGFYLVVPLFGTTSLRDGLASLGNTAMNPAYTNLDTGEIMALTLMDAEVALSLDKDTYEALYDDALDPYVFFRSAWVQNRAGKVDQ